MSNPSGPREATSGGGDQTAALISQLHSRNGLARARARRSLTKAGRKAIPGLVREIKSPVKQYRWEVMKTLVSLAELSLLPDFLAALVDPDFDIAWLATEGLIRLGRPAWPELLRAFLRHPDSAVWRKTMHHIFNCQRRYPGNEFLGPFVLSLEESVPRETALVEADALLSRL